MISLFALKNLNRKEGFYVYYLYRVLFNIRARIWVIL